MKTNTQMQKSKLTNENEYTNSSIRNNSSKKSSSIRSFVPIRNRGFTLIEVLLAAFIFTVTIGAITVVFTSSSNVQTQNQVIRETNQSVQYAMEAISREVKAAQSTYYSASDPEVQSDNALLGKLKEPAFEILLNGSQLTVHAQDGQKVYSLLDDILYVNNNAMTNINEVKITRLSFEGLEPVDGLTQQPYVTIKITAQSAQNEGGKTSEKASQELETTITSNYYPYSFTP